MTSGQKIAFSLLAALALFAVLVMSLHSALFKTLETRFYAQAKIEEKTGQLDKISESCDSYISEILSLVEKGDNAWTKNASVRSYYVQNPSESDVNIRRRLTESLFAEIPALSGIRIVDKNGRNVHYSSFDDTDLLKQTGISKIYKNYNDIIKDAGEITFEQLQKISSETKTVLLCDEERSRLIFSVPFCWVDGIYSGMALFYLNLNEVENELVRRNVVSMGHNLTLFADEDYNGGFVLDLPRSGKTEFRSPFLNYWKNRSQVLRGGDQLQQPEKLLALPDGRYYVSLSSNRIGKIRISAVYTSDLFELSAEIKVLVYICIFISILLIVFLIFSFIRDPMVTLQKRIKKIQLEIIEDYIDGKEKREWSDLTRHLRQRKNDLSEDIIKSLHVHSKKRRKELSDYLDKNWDEIFAIFETKTSAAQTTNVSGAAELTGTSIAEIRRMLEEVLANRNIVAPVTAAGVVAAGVAGVAAASAVKKAAAPVQEADDVDELDEVEDLDDAEELDEVEDLDDAEELDEVEEVDDAEELDEVEEIEEAEDAEEVEELVEEAEDAEEVDDAEEVEELAEEVEETEEAAEESDEVEELDEEVEDLDEAEEVNETEEPVEELEGEDEVETLDEPVDEAEEEELDELEEVEELEGVEDGDAVDAFLKSITPPKLDFTPSNDTYFISEKFANVENLFAEELKLGNFEPFYKKGSKPLEIKLYPIPGYEDEETKPEEIKPEEVESENPQPEAVQSENTETVNPQSEAAQIDELTEEIPSYLPEPDFSMTSFGDNLTDDLPELQEEKVIVEEDGVFSIAENLEYTDVIQDADFKSLVDSVL